MSISHILTMSSTASNRIFLGKDHQDDDGDHHLPADAQRRPRRLLRRRVPSCDLFII